MPHQLEYWPRGRPANWLLRPKPKRESMISFYVGLGIGLVLVTFVVVLLWLGRIG